MKTILEKALGRQRVLVKENERAVALYKGEIQAVLMPGEHWLANRRGNLEISRHDLKNPEFVSAYEKAL
ncbi:MAG: slipin family protein, partial [Mesorhizobium sp.]